MNNRGELPDDLKIRQGYRLPHYTSKIAQYHCTFRTFGSVPSHIIKTYKAEQVLQMRNAENQNIIDPNIRIYAQRMIEKYLDKGISYCPLRTIDGAAEIVANTIQHFESDRYRLHAWCVMPNHVHLIIEPSPEHQLPKIVHSIKSFSAHEIKKIALSNSPFWQKEYYDHLIRNEDSLAKHVEYVYNNPEYAGLNNWPYKWKE